MICSCLETRPLRYTCTLLHISKNYSHKIVDLIHASFIENRKGNSDDNSLFSPRSTHSLSTVLVVQFCIAIKPSNQTRRHQTKSGHNSTNTQQNLSPPPFAKDDNLHHGKELLLSSHESEEYRKIYTLTNEGAETCPLRQARTSQNSTAAATAQIPKVGELLGARKRVCA